MEDNEYKKLEDIFFEFIKRKGLRKTPERGMILKMIYGYKTHFDVETLYTKMKDEKYKVSRATIYNNLSLLLKCGIVREHVIDKNQAYYELSYRNKQHDHIICTDTGKIIEFCDPRIQEIKKTLEEMFDISIYNHSLYFYANIKK